MLPRGHRSPTSARTTRRWKSTAGSSSSRKPQEEIMTPASDQQPRQIAALRGLSPVGSTAVGRDQVRAVFGQVMGLVAATGGFTALGAYIGRNLTGGTRILFFIARPACNLGLQ